MALAVNDLKAGIRALCIAALLSACGGGSGGSSTAPPVVNPAPLPAFTLPTGPALQAALNVERSAIGAVTLPGVTVVVVNNDRIESAVAGVRKMGASAPVLLSDQFQLGSLTKGATALLIARRVEKNKLRWDSTLVELFPEWREKMHPALPAITVEQILLHRGGFKRSIDWVDGLVLRLRATGNLSADRLLAAEFLLQAPPAQLPGDFSYSNAGFQVLGLIAERSGGLGYEALMEKEVFAPLNMQATFGVPDEAGEAALSGHCLVNAA